MTIHPVILSGGSGTRLWPLSRESFPKQLHNLFGEHSLLQETAARVAGLGAPLIVCNNEHRFIIGEQLRAIWVMPHGIVLEPTGRNTAPAAAVAALMLQGDGDDVRLLLLPSDHLIRDPEASSKAVTIAAGMPSDALVCFGVKPDRPQTGHGYIKRGGQSATAPNGSTDSSRSRTHRPRKAICKAGITTGTPGSFSCR